jgi:hypothetical protein
MSPQEFNDTLGELGLSQVDTARLLAVDARTVRRWVASAEEITGPAEQALRAWRRLNHLGLPWSPDSTDLVETDPEQIAAHRIHAIDLTNLLLKVHQRGGPSGAWTVDLERSKATLGPYAVSFYRTMTGSFSPQSYKRTDDTPADLQRDWPYIEDAFACIAAAISKE